jgi:hypothetical protein
MEWHWCSWGEWHGPFTLQRINKLTAKMPNQFLMAGGGTDAELDELRTYPRLGGLAILSPHVTPASVSTLRSFPDLRELILSETGWRGSHGYDEAAGTGDILFLSANPPHSGPSVE